MLPAASGRPAHLRTSHFHYLDAARAVLMIMGIVFHAARPYTIREWALRDPTTHPAFDALALFLTSFRMQSFFVISGFFAAMSLARWGPVGLLRKRVPRILVPLVSTMFTVNVVQLYVLHVYAGGTPGFFGYLMSSALWNDFGSERWLSHLWFLACLAWYFLAFAVGATLVGRLGIGKSLTGSLGRPTLMFDRPAICLGLFPLLHIGIAAVFFVVPVLHQVRLVASLHEIATFFPFFLVGLLVYASPSFYDSMTRFNRGVLVLTVPAAAYQLATAAAAPMASVQGRIVDAYGDALWTWVAIYWVLVFFRRVLPEPRPAVRRLADGSYTIYLFHHAAVIVAAVWVMDWPISIFLKYPIVVAVTFVFTLAVHELAVKRVPLLSLLFNGRIRRPRVEARDDEPVGTFGEAPVDVSRR